MIITREQLQQVSDADYYDGSILHDRFAYKTCRAIRNDDPEARIYPTAYGNIFAFQAPMKVTDHLVDLEDSLSNDFIHSESAINFIIELPNVSALTGVLFQRLFNVNLSAILMAQTQTHYIVNGDDILQPDGVQLGSVKGQPDGTGKVSVSISHKVDDAVLIHTGINIKPGSDAPDFAVGTNMSDEEANNFMQAGIDLFNFMAYDCFEATTKTIR